jgi:hypothetical protein
MREHGVRSVLAICQEASCSHSASINVDELPDDFAAPDVSVRLRCSACGSHNVKDAAGMARVRLGSGLREGLLRVC